MNKPKIFEQPEKSSYCGACCAKTVLTHFGMESDSIGDIYKEIRGQGRSYGSEGIYTSHLLSYLQGKGLVAFQAHSYGPSHKKDDGTEARSHELPHQIIASWKNFHDMLKCGYLIILTIDTLNNTTHFVVVYDTFIKRRRYFMRVADSVDGYVTMEAEKYLYKTGTECIYVKKTDDEYR